MTHARNARAVGLQVMDVATAPPHTLEIRKPNTTLVSFFGDASFGWFTAETLTPFEKDRERLLAQKKTKVAGGGCEGLVRARWEGRRQRWRRWLVACAWLKHEPFHFPFHPSLPL